MPQFNADGDVIEVALHTVKVQNWDKAITTIPTHKLISESFKNWRGMSESGGRRVKRSIHIDMLSVRFLTDQEIEWLRSFAPLHEYMDSKLEELDAHAADHVVEPGMTSDPRRLTNIGTLRAYIVSYLKQHPDLDTEGMTFLVRQLKPGSQGLPIEIYVFSSDTRWSAYEDIQADIFEHILAMIPEFRPAGLPGTVGSRRAGDRRHRQCRRRGDRLRCFSGLASPPPTFRLTTANGSTNKR